MCSVSTDKNEVSVDSSGFSAIVKIRYWIVWLTTEDAVVAAAAQSKVRHDRIAIDSISFRARHDGRDGDVRGMRG